MKPGAKGREMRRDTAQSLEEKVFVFVQPKMVHDAPQVVPRQAAGGPSCVNTPSRARRRARSPSR